VPVLREVIASHDISAHAILRCCDLRAAAVRRHDSHRLPSFPFKGLPTLND
jgi:hypothetical protein